MKNMLLIVVLLAIFACDREEEVLDQKTSIYGTWQIVEVYNAMAGWAEVSDGYSYTLNKDLTFTTNKYPECDSGSFLIDGDTIEMEFSCENFECVPSNAFCKDLYSFEDNYLLLQPVGCFEGCIAKFKRINTGR